MRTRVLIGCIAVLIAVAWLLWLWFAYADSPRATREHINVDLSGAAATQGSLKAGEAAYAARSRILFQQPSGMDGMVETAQPSGCVITLVRESLDGRYTAFVSEDADADRILVVDRKTGDQYVMPCPAGRLLERRWHDSVQWGADQTLYCVQSVMDSTLTPTQYAKLDPSQVRSALYSWKPGDAQVVSVDQIRGVYAGLTVGSDGFVRLTSRSSEKGWGFVDIRLHRDGKPQGSRTFPVMIAGKPADVWGPQALSKRNELWFITQSEGRQWLALLDLDHPDAGARLMTPDVSDIVLSPDEEQLILLKKAFTPATAAYSFYALQTAAKGDPVLLLAREFGLGGNPWGPDFAGLSTDGKRVYFRCLAKKEVSISELAEPGGTRIREFGIK